MSGSANNLPIRITVDGAPQAEAAFNSIATTGERAMARVSQGAQQSQASTRGFNTAIQQGGFQLQDFVVQVQGGTSALTALSQQGSQFLGIFGPAGAVAGAALTVGLLAAQFLGLGTAAQTGASTAEAAMRGMRSGAEDLAKAIDAVNNLFLTQGERAAQAANASRQAIGETLRQQRDIALQFQEASAAQMVTAEADLRRLQSGMETAAQGRILMQRAAEARAAARGEPPPAPFSVEVPSRELFSAQALVDGLRADVQRSGAAMARAQAALDRIPNAGVAGPEQFGPPAPEASRAGREPRTTFNLEDALARTRNENLAEQERLIQQNETAYERYQRRLESLSELVERSNNLGVPLSSDEIEREASAAIAALNRVEQQTTRTSDIGRQLGLTFSSAFEDAISKGKDLGTVMTSLGEDIAKLIIRFTVLEPLARSVQGLFNDQSKGSGGGGGGMWSSIGTAVGGLLGGGTAAAPAAVPKIAGAKAAGGPVSGGLTYLVGERGPELFTPGASGGITPNHALGGSNFAPVYNIDARGADPSVLPRMEAIARAVSAQTFAKFTDSIHRGGGGAKLVGRR